MSAETQAYTVLSGAAAVTAIVGTRIYPDAVPQEQAFPSVALLRTDTEYVTTIHSGVPLAAKVTLDVWCMAAGRKAAEDLADAVETALGGNSFNMAGRRPEFDEETNIHSTVLTVFYWQ